jgi:hypothetical protein
LSDGGDLLREVFGVLKGIGDGLGDGGGDLDASIELLEADLVKNSRGSLGVG